MRQMATAVAMTLALVAALLVGSTNTQRAEAAPVAISAAPKFCHPVRSTGNWDVFVNRSIPFIWRKSVWKTRLVIFQRSCMNVSIVKKVQVQFRHRNSEGGASVCHGFERFWANPDIIGFYNPRTLATNCWDSVPKVNLTWKPWPRERVGKHWSSARRCIDGRVGAVTGNNTPDPGANMGPVCIR